MAKELPTEIMCKYYSKAVELCDATTPMHRKSTCIEVKVFKQNESEMLED